VEVFWQRKIPSFHAGWQRPRDDDAYRVVAEDAYSLGKGQRVSKMSFRFRKRISLGKFLHMNLSKSGASLSAAGAGATVNVGCRGTTATVGIPGSGVSYQTRLGKRRASAGPSLFTIAIEVAAVIGVLWWLFGR